MGAAEVEHFLTQLAVKRKVSASTQNQALNMDVLMSRRSWMTESDKKRTFISLQRSVGH
jgi:hypothetical protein